MKAVKDAAIEFFSDWEFIEVEDEEVAAATYTY